MCAIETEKSVLLVKNESQFNTVQCEGDGQQQRLSMIIWKDDFPNGRLANMETKWL